MLTRQFQAKIFKKLADDPYMFFTVLGDSLPKVCGFFCDYVIIRAFTGMSMELVRAYNIFPGLLALITCKKKWSRGLVATAVEVGGWIYEYISISVYRYIVMSLYGGGGAGLKGSA